MNLKDLEGKEVYFEPTGNNARALNGEPRIGTIVKVATKFATVKIASGWDQKLRFDGMKLSDGCNSGYIVYKSMDDFQHEIDMRKMTSKVGSFFRDYSWSKNLSDREIFQIHDIIKDVIK